MPSISIIRACGAVASLSGGEMSHCESETALAGREEGGLPDPHVICWTKSRYSTFTMQWTSEIAVEVTLYTCSYGTTWYVLMDILSLYVRFPQLVRLLRRKSEIRS